MQDSRIEVYSRVCGGAVNVVQVIMLLRDLFPRVRGNLTHRGSPSMAGFLASEPRKSRRTDLSWPDSATKMEISDSFADRSALALSFVPIRRGDHARCTQEFDGR